MVPAAFPSQHGGLDTSEPGFAVLLAAPDLSGLKDAALVLSSQGIPHDVARGERELFLVVPAAHARRAREQLVRYEEERRRFRPRVQHPELVTDGIRGALAYAFAVTFVFALQSTRAFDLDWKGRGLSDSAELGGGAWWRAMTSLTLHADVQHLLGNIVFGVLFGVLVAQLLGSGVGWLAVLLSGFLGNLVNAAIQPELHRSIGASTSVFGALGLLVGFELVRRKRADLGFVRRWAPLLFGSFLLAWLGFGGEEGAGNTDVLAHVFGFASGVGLGTGLAVLDRRTDLTRTRLQALCAGAAVGLLVVAWGLAHALG